MCLIVPAWKTQSLILKLASCGAVNDLFLCDRKPAIYKWESKYVSK